MMVLPVRISVSSTGMKNYIYFFFLNCPINELAQWPRVNSANARPAEADG